MVQEVLLLVLDLGPSLPVTTLITQGGNQQTQLYREVVLPRLLGVSTKGGVLFLR